MKFSKLLILQTLFLYGSLAYSENAVNLSRLLVQGNLEYENGECDKAIETYGSVLKINSAESADYELALFRKSFCHLNIDQSHEAREGFEALVKSHRGDSEYDEARLKLAEAQMLEGDYDQAERTATNIRAEDFRMDAFFIIVQARIESGDPSGAFKQLKKFEKSNTQWVPIYQYWAGVSLYNIGDRKKALAYFDSATKISDSKLWVKSAAKEWADSIRHELRFIKGHATLGYLVDSNVGQSGTQKVTTYGIPEEPVDGDSNTYISDKAYWAGVELSLLLFEKFPWSVQLGLDATSPFYLNNSAYNNQNLSADLLVMHRTGYRWMSGLSLKYLDSRYNKIYYQDYMTASFSEDWQMSTKVSFRFDLGTTYAVKTKHSSQYSTGLTGRFVLNRFASAFGSASYSKATGTVATYTNTSPSYWDTGTVFSNYATIGAYYGMTFALPARIDLTGLLSVYQTNYAAEAVPSKALNGVEAARTDRLITYSAEIGRTMIPRIWNVSLRYNLSTNESTGLQGLPSGYTMANYNYTRSYILFSNTISF